MAQRVTIRKRTPYNTTSNRRRVIKTPGGKLVYHHLKKLGTAPKCGDCGIALPGVPALRPRQYATISKRQKTVQRAYGGSRCGDCVKSRILRAFLVEEAKIVKKVIKSQTATRNKAKALNFPTIIPSTTIIIATMPPYSNLHRNTWVRTQYHVLEQDTDLLSGIIVGHLIYHLSTPASFLTWDVDNMSRRIQGLILRVAQRYPRIRPNVAIRALLAVLRYKNRHPKIIAFDDDAEMLYMVAFMTTAHAYEPRLTKRRLMEIVQYGIHASKLSEYRHLLDSEVSKELGSERLKSKSTVQVILDYHLSPFYDSRKTRIAAGTSEAQCPTMPAFQSIEPEVPGRTEQAMVFPDMISKMKRQLSPIYEDPSGGPTRQEDYLTCMLRQSIRGKNSVGQGGYVDEISDLSSLLDYSSSDLDSDGSSIESFADAYFASIYSSDSSRSSIFSSLFPLFACFSSIPQSWRFDDE
ncbi:hypothetical protein MD484_g4220, partial [Candolleomyces efflorescens]